MGCKHSKQIDKSIVNKVDNNEDNNNNNNNELDRKVDCVNGDVKRVTFNLTVSQINMIENTWKLLVENISKVGVITFMRLFETHPDVQDVFLPFRGFTQEDLKYSKELRAHALRVMGSIQKVVARLNEPSKCEQLLRELGKRHTNYGAKANYVEFVGQQFIFAIKPALEAYWSLEVEQAWQALFTYVNFHIADSMLEALKENKR